VTSVVLETLGLTKSFMGFVAVEDVSLKVSRGQIHALIGPNGAGKSTFFNLLTKFIKPTRGAIHFNGVDITSEKPAETARRGVVRSFQISAIFPHLTVLQNVRLALQQKEGMVHQFWKPASVLAALNDRAHEVLALVDLEAVADRPAVNLAYGQKRALELAATLAAEPELMLLDEPTQGMGHEDVEKIAQLIKRLSAGRTVLMVEHNMSVVSGISDCISVMQRGSIIAQGAYSEVTRDPKVMEAYMGEVSDD